MRIPIYLLLQRLFSKVRAIFVLQMSNFLELPSFSVDF